MPSAIVPPSRILQQPAHMAGLLWRRASALAVAAPGLAAHLQSSDERCTRRPSSFPCNLWPAWVAPTGGHRPLLRGGHKRGTKRSAEGQSVLPGGAFTRCGFCLQGLSSATWAQRWQTAQKRASGSLQVHLCPAIVVASASSTYLCVRGFDAKDVQKLDYAAMAWKGCDPFKRQPRLEDEVKEVRVRLSCRASHSNRCSFVRRSNGKRSALQKKWSRNARQ